ncbi:IS66 family transposase zinc-finger binding domain-containing protein [Nocardia sp. NPDC050799]|uniref:IS66 family transposase zinc-finger binding domain-containing protein n=1 Tax=Nocardia sp. NPDC050799 TaxID=3154842 RepID=UPI0033EC5136
MYADALDQARTTRHRRARRCPGCGGRDGGSAGARGVSVECHQMFDLPPSQLEVTEHRLVTRRHKVWYEDPGTEQSPVVSIDSLNLSRRCGLRLSTGLPGA